MNTDDATVCNECGIRFEHIQSSTQEHAVPSQKSLRKNKKYKTLCIVLVLTFVFVVFAALIVMVWNGHLNNIVRHMGMRDDFMTQSVSQEESQVDIDTTRMGDLNTQGIPYLQENLGESSISDNLEQRKYLPIENVEENERTYFKRHPPYDLGVEFIGDENAWKVDWNEFKHKHPGLWFWTDGEDIRSIRNDCVLFFGHTICENSLTFGNSGLERIEVSIFNKGILGALITESDAIATIDSISSGIESDAVDVSHTDDGSGKSITRYTWIAAYPQVTASLGMRLYGNEWGAEYLNFVISRIEENQSPPSRLPRDNVQRSGDDVYINGVPMVNQGRKGYCVPATISRILKYYGISADMNDLALIMETECGGGTKTGGEFPTLNRIADETGLKRTDYRNLEKYDAEYVERYNAAARDNGGEELDIKDFTVDEVDSEGRLVHMRHYDWMFDAMDGELKRKSRYYDQSGYMTFKDGIINSIKNGYPLIWSVDKLFSWERVDNGLSKGHMRLIVGYNMKTDELLYSDSWGSGNEFKRVSMFDAWGVTKFMSCLSPR